MFVLQIGIRLSTSVTSKFEASQKHQYRMSVLPTLFFSCYLGIKTMLMATLKSYCCSYEHVVTDRQTDRQAVLRYYADILEWESLIIIINNNKYNSLLRNISRVGVKNVLKKFYFLWNRILQHRVYKFPRCVLSSVPAIYLQFTNVRYISVLTSELSAGELCSVPSRCLCCIFQSSSLCDLKSLTVTGKENKLWSFSLSHLLNSSLISCVWGPNILFGIFWIVIWMQHQISYPHKMMDRNTWYSSMCFSF